MLAFPSALVCVSCIYPPLKFSQVLERMEHRGGCGCEVNTGDGSGALFAIPDTFYRKECKAAGVELPAEGRCVWMGERRGGAGESMHGQVEGFICLSAFPPSPLATSYYLRVHSGTAQGCFSSQRHQACLKNAKR